MFVLEARTYAVAFLARLRTDITSERIRRELDRKPPMTELRDRTQPPATPQPAATDPGAGAADPLHNLYRMSRTAGLGSGDYVAINNTAIVALLLGLASTFALLWPAALVVAAGAVVCGILALIQIRSSNGTETGRTFAILGILLGIGLGGAAGGKIVLRGFEHRRDEAKIDELVKQLNDKIVARQYGQAYQTLFSEDFKKAFSEAEFSRRWESHIPMMGDVESINWGKRAEIETVRATGEKRGIASSIIKFKKFPDVATQPITLLYHDGEWVIDGISQIFDKPKPGGADSNDSAPNPLDPQGPIFKIPGTEGPK
jgi:hypothetical protein